MASTGTEREEPHVPLDELRHPEPAFREAQKWIEEVTGKSFGEKDFRGGLENGILLCELLCSIRPGLVQKINRLPSPIAGLDNLSVFLRGCEELGLKGSQLFNPGDLQDTSIQANLRDSECSRKLKNVLITIFWLGKASSVCPSYDGPVLNLREFEGLRSHMRTLSEDRSGSDSVRPGVRDSGYDCWDSERSQSLSPRQHTRGNSLDSLDSFGSRSQTSPSPDVIIHGNSDVDSDGDAPNRKADVRRDDMLARRTSAGDSRTFVPFNQFLPNRNVSAYVPTTRRRSRPQDGEHGSESSPSPVCQACLEKGSGTPDIISMATGSMRGCSKVVTFGGVTELEKQPISSSREGEESQLLRRLLAKATVAMPIIALGSQLSEQQDSHMGGVDAAHTPPPNPGPSPLSPEAPPTLLELEARLAQYQRRVREEEEDGGRDERKVPDLQKDDMMARKTGAFPRTHNTTTTTFNRFLPLPGSKRPAQEVVTDRKLQQSRVSMDMPQQHPNVAMVIRPPVPSHCNYDDDDEDEEECPVPDLEKDDMLARRTGAYQHSAGRTGRSFNLFLPVPGAAQQKNTPSGGPNQLYKNTPSGGPNQLYQNTPSGGPNQLYKNTPSGGPNQLYQNTSSGGPNPLYRHKQQPSSGVSTATGTEAQPSRTPNRKCLEDNPYLSSPSSPSTLLSSHTHTPPPTPPL
uniref:Calponin-homology (CH) domain-containing protein n=1 Tax=Oncorhynchus tshawytscha TaxID=74940 RepID=A0AAZ3R8P7_ONCTS